MKEANKTDPLELLVDQWVDELLSLSDTDLVLEAHEAGEDPEAVAEQMRQAAREVARKIGRRRFDDAKAALAGRPLFSQRTGLGHMSLADKQRIIGRISPNDPRLKGRLTLAARGREGATEQEVDGVLEDLIGLGVIDSSGNEL